MIRTIGDLSYRARPLIIALWLALVAGALLWLPDLGAVVAHKDMATLPSSSPVVQAENLAKRVDPAHAGATTAVLAIRNAHGLTHADTAYFARVLRDLAAHKNHYNLSSVTDAASAGPAASAFTSKDGTTALALVAFRSGDLTDATKHAVAALRGALAHPPRDARTYVTGEAAIQADYTAVTQDGVRQTEGVTIALVLLILLVVFRAPLAPFVPLLAIGLSYLLSSRLVALLGQHGLPVSSFTQTFLVAVLFGAGTDYCLLLVSRFREELAKTPDTAAALDRTLASTGLTVLFSGLTVLIAFATLVFAGFGLYRSAVGVAIGLAITLLACLTFVPALLGVLGPRLFWPRRPQRAAHGDSRLWGWAGRIATARPWLTAGLVLAAIAPLALLFADRRSFDPLAEISPRVPAVAGFNAVSAAFSPGRVLPMTIVLQTPENLRTARGLAAVETISRILAAQPYVREVDSATRPTGRVISSFQLAHDNKQAASGAASVQDGLNRLVAALGRTDTGVQHLQSATGQFEQGLSRLERGSGTTASGAAALAQNARQLARGAAAIQSGATQLESPAQALAGELQGVQGTGQQAQGLAGGTSTLAQQSAQLAAGSAALAQGAARLQAGTSSVQSGIVQARQGARQLHGALATLHAALRQEIRGARALSSGLGTLHGYLAESAAAASVDPGFYVPDAALRHNADLQRAMNAYISPDGHTATLTVVLTINPYAQSAIDAVPQLIGAARDALRAGGIAAGTVQAGGTTPEQAALGDVSQTDFIRTAILVLATVYLLLAVLLRSAIAPLYVIVSLGGAYLVTMTALQALFVDLLHRPGLSWTVPFFVFFLLVALGVDYSIFLMSRFTEEYAAGHAPAAAMRRAMAGMGGVIVSAAVIMAGTFGSLTTSGITALLEIGIAVIVGLFIYTVVMLGFFVPACAAIVGHGHHWPWSSRASEAAERPDPQASRQGAAPHGAVRTQPGLY